MAERSRRAQRAHDMAVAREAERLDADGWDVHADVDGWPAPPQLGGRQPDLVGLRRHEARAIEVETDSGVDTGQHETFRRVADIRDATFVLLLVDANGRVIQRRTGEAVGD